MKKQIEVVGAVITRGSTVLCAQRGSSSALPLKWEFPGGKVEQGETAREALVREIDEELQCEVLVGEHLDTTVHEYDFGVVTLTTFYCELISGIPTLTEHADATWLERDQLHRLDWAPADIPAVKKIQAHGVST